MLVVGTEKVMAGQRGTEMESIDVCALAVAQNSGTFGLISCPWSLSFFFRCGPIRPTLISYSVSTPTPPPTS